MATQKQILAAQELINSQSSALLDGLVTVIIQTMLQTSVGKTLFNTIEVMEVTLTGVVTKVRVGKKFYRLAADTWVTKRKPKK